MLTAGRQAGAPDDDLPAGTEPRTVALPSPRRPADPWPGIPAAVGQRGIDRWAGGQYTDGRWAGGYRPQAPGPWPPGPAPAWHPGPGWPGPAPAGVPPHLAFALDGPSRPGAATAAGVLWIVLGVVELFWAAALFGFGDLPVLVPALVTAAGIATVALSVAMLAGYEWARTAVVVLGGLSLVGALPLLLWVPAVILQLRPSAVAWSADATRRRRAYRRS